MAKRAEQTKEAQVKAFAEDLGQLLGTARAKAGSWLNQRQEILQHLTNIRDTASKLLTQLGDTSQRAISRGRAAYQAASANASGGTGAARKKKRRRMSKAARAKIAAAQRARWARQKAARR